MSLHGNSVTMPWEMHWSTGCRRRRYREIKSPPCTARRCPGSRRLVKRPPHQRTALERRQQLRRQEAGRRPSPSTEASGRTMHPFATHRFLWVAFGFAPRVPRARLSGRSTRKQRIAPPPAHAVRSTPSRRRRPQPRASRPLHVDEALLPPLAACPPYSTRGRLRRHSADTRRASSATP